MIIEQVENIAPGRVKRIFCFFIGVRLYINVNRITINSMIVIINNIGVNTDEFFLKKLTKMV